MYFDVEDSIRGCLKCQQNRPGNRLGPIKLTPPRFAWHTVSLDVVGPLPTAPGNFKYIIVAIDEMTKWIEVKAIKNLDAVTTACFIINQII